MYFVACTTNVFVHLSFHSLILFIGKLLEMTISKFNSQCRQCRLKDSEFLYYLHAKI